MHPLIALATVEAAAAVFAPPLDRPIAYRVTETRTDDRGSQRFTIDRRVTFRRRAGGFVAIVETLHVDGMGGRGPGKIFEATVGDTIGRAVRILLDEGGRVVDVEDRDAEWSRRIAALDRALDGGGAARRATVASLTAPMRALDGPAKATRIAEVVDGLLGAAMLRQGVFPARAMTMNGSGPAGPVALRGIEAATRTADGGITYERTATGDAMQVAETRVARPDGLVGETVETRTLHAGGRTMTIVRRTVIR